MFQQFRFGRDRIGISDLPRGTLPVFKLGPTLLVRTQKLIRSKRENLGSIGLRGCALAGRFLLGHGSRGNHAAAPHFTLSAPRRFLPTFILEIGAVAGARAL